MLASVHEKKIHELRLEIKFLRAELRLLKALERKPPRELNQKLRAIAHALSPFRDEHVRSKWLSRHGFAQKDKKSPSPKTPNLASVETEIREARQALAPYSPRTFPGPLLKKALKKSARKVKRAKKRALKEPEDKNFHEWRKRAKDLLYQLEFLGKKGKPEAKKLLTLTKTLGRAQDSSLVQHAALPAGVKSKALKIAEKEKKQLHGEALRL